LETTEATHSMRNTRRCSGAQGDVVEALPFWVIKADATSAS